MRFMWCNAVMHLFKFFWRILRCITLLEGQTRHGNQEALVRKSTKWHVWAVPLGRGFAYSGQIVILLPLEAYGLTRTAVHSNCFGACCWFFPRIFALDISFFALLRLAWRVCELAQISKRIRDLVVN